MFGGGEKPSEPELYQEGEVVFDPSKLDMGELLEKYKEISGSRTSLNRSSDPFDEQIRQEVVKRLKFLDSEARKKIYAESGLEPDSMEKFLNS